MKILMKKDSKLEIIDSETSIFIFIRVNKLVINFSKHWGAFKIKDIKIRNISLVFCKQFCCIIFVVKQLVLTSQY